MEYCAGIAWFRVLITIASHMEFHCCAGYVRRVTHDEIADPVG